MPAERLSMRKTREVLRLKWALGLSARQAAGSAAVARSTVSECLRRAAAAGLTWAQVEALSDAQLEACLYPPPPRPAAGARALPDWQALHDELKRKGVTRFRLWEEYKEAHPEGYAYSRFCELYRAWRRQLDVVMRQDHRAGEKLFVDYAGQTVPLVDDEHRRGRAGADLRRGAGGLKLHLRRGDAGARGCRTGSASHVRAFASSAACRAGDRARQPQGRRRAARTATSPRSTPPTRSWPAITAAPSCRRASRSPRDKAKVEVGVQVVERWILARLRNHTFFSLAELNAAIAQLLAALNEQPFKKLPGSRRTLFDRSSSRAAPLPASPYVFAEWKQRQVGHRLPRRGRRPLLLACPTSWSASASTCASPPARWSASTTASGSPAHLRSAAPRAATPRCASTCPAPTARYAEWTPQRLVRWAEEIGPRRRHASWRRSWPRRAHPAAGLPLLPRASCGSAKRYGAERLEAACGRALRRRLRATRA